MVILASSSPCSSALSAVIGQCHGHDSSLAANDGVEFIAAAGFLPLKKFPIHPKRQKPMDPFLPVSS